MHLADLHLGASLAYLGERARERSRDLEDAFARALALAPARNVHAIVIAGDLFDSFRPQPDLVARVKSLLENAANEGIPIILISGTHDSHRYSRSVYRREKFPGVDILLDNGATICKRLSGRDVYFYGFTGGTEAVDRSGAFRRNDKEGIHVALVHGSVTEAEHWSKSSRDFSLRPRDLEQSGFDYVALGHHHNFKEFRCGSVTAVYPGTLEGLKFGENGDRHATISEVGETTANIEKIRINRRTLTEVAVNLSTDGIESNETLAEALRKYSDPSVLLKATLSGTANFIPEKQQLEDRLANHFFHLEIVDCATLFESDMVGSIMRENTVRGLFVRKLLERIEDVSGEDKEAAELALRLGIEEFSRVHDENRQNID